MSSIKSTYKQTKAKGRVPTRTGHSFASSFRKPFRPRPRKRRRCSRRRKPKAKAKFGSIKSSGLKHLVSTSKHKITTGKHLRSKAIHKGRRKHLRSKFRNHR